MKAMKRVASFTAVSPVLLAGNATVAAAQSQKKNEILKCFIFLVVV